MAGLAGIIRLTKHLRNNIFQTSFKHFAKTVEHLILALHYKKAYVKSYNRKWNTS